MSVSLLDYQHFLHDNKIMSSSLNSEYIYDNGYNSASATPAAYQQVNNIYWTLQNHSRGNNPHHLNDDPYQTSRDDFKVQKQADHQLLPTQAFNNDNNRMTESLYAKPHENFRSQLKTTPLGFEFYSPVPTARQSDRPLTMQENVANHIRAARSGVFSTSTPQKSDDLNSPSKVSAATEELRTRLSHLGVRSHGSSPINSGRSTPSRVFEPQQTSRTRHSWSSNNVNVPMSTCSDRLGAPKTSLMDFKKLLLNKTGGANKSSAKISAVEQLKLSREKLNASAPSPTRGLMSTSMNILDLSSSPKTFATRRMIRQGQFGQSLVSSPTKLSSKQKQAWRMQNMKSDVISTAIPEAAQDEEVQENLSNVNLKKPPAEKLKSPEIVIEEALEEPKPLNIRENLFMRQQENNFTEREIREHKKSVNLRSSNIPTPSYLQANNHANETNSTDSGDGQSKKPSNLPISLETAL